MKIRTLPRLIALALVQAAVIAALAISATAQITTTGIRGIVRDPNGAVVPRATVKVTDNATGVEQTSVSSSDGGVAGQYPINLFQANPYLSTLTYQDSNGDNNYNGLQIDLKQRYSYGLMLGANYVWSHAMGSILNETDQAAGYTWFTLRNARQNYGPSPFDRRHVFNAYWTYDLPFGKGRRFLSSNAFLDRLVGGWTLGGRETIASGHPFLLNGGRNTVNNLTQSGVVFGGGFTPEQLQRALGTVGGSFSRTALISNVASIATITQTATASTSQVKPDLYAPASTPGQYGAFIYLRNNNLYTLDMSVNKDVRITERMRLTLRLVALNFLNRP